MARRPRTGYARAGYAADRKARLKWGSGLSFYSEHGKAVVERHDDPSERPPVDEREFGFHTGWEAEAIYTREYTRATDETVIFGFTVRDIIMPLTAREELREMLRKDDFQSVIVIEAPPLREDLLLDQSLWAGPNGVIYIQGQSGLRGDVASALRVTTTKRELAKRYLDWWEKQPDEIATDRISHARVGGVFIGNRGAPELRDFNEPIGWPLERANYDARTLFFYDTVKRELPSPTPAGRLVILDGPPGTGKTYLLRALVHDLADKLRFIYLPAGMVDQLDGPSMLSLLEDDHSEVPKVFIIEDADECLVSRGPDNMSSIRNLLNYCDGFLGAMLNIRIVATTNSGHIGRTDKTDQALLRPGRLLERATVGPLPQEQAQERLAEMLGGDAPITYGAAVMLSQVYLDARKAGWRPRER